MASEKMQLTAHSDVRCDTYIAENTDITRSFGKQLFEKKLVTVNGKVVKPSYKLKAGDIVELEVPEVTVLEAKPQDIPLDIVYEDGDVLIINKPRGMVVHPAAGNEDSTLVNAVMYHCGEDLSGINGVLRPGIVHRIDKDTTGLLAVAKNNSSHLALTSQLSDHTLGRTYFAIVHGNITEDEGMVDAPIARSEKDRKKMAVAHKNGREAVTFFKVLERFGKYTLVRCRLKTGRTHQIRVHMKHIGHPILGDKAYGVKKEEFSASGQLLHAGEIEFIHPGSGEKVSFSAPLPQDFEKILNIIREKYS